MDLHSIISKRYRTFVKEASTKTNHSPNNMVWRRFCRNKTAVASLVAIALITVVAILGYTITPDSTHHCNQQYLELSTLKPMSKATFIYIHKDGTKEPAGFFKKMLHGEELNYTAIPIYRHRTTGDSIEVETYTGSTPNDGEIRKYSKEEVVKIATRRFILGTDGYGRDVLSMIMIGSRVSLSVGFIAILIALVIGITLGALAAFYGKWVDNLIMLLINIVWSVPTVLLVIAITFALGKGFWQIFIAVGLTMWVDIARVVRGQVFTIKEKEYIEATKALGYSTARTIFRHILPNIMGSVIVVATSNFASAILLEAGLSFLGIGVQPPMPSWGGMVKENYGYILLDNAYLALIPGMAIMVIVLSFMLLGNGIRDALDVKNPT